MATRALTLDDVNLLDHDLFAEREPWDVFELLQREAPVFRHPEPDGDGFWCVTRYDDVVQVLKDTGTFSSESGGAALIEPVPRDVLEARRNFMETDPPLHSQWRRMFARDFTPRSLADRYRSYLQELTRTTLDETLPKGEFCFVEEIAGPIPIRVLGHMLGVPDEHLDKLVELGDRMLVPTDPDLTPPSTLTPEQSKYLPFGSEAGAELLELGRPLIEERKGHPCGDVLSILANAEIGGCPVSQHDLDNNLALLVVAGNETTRQGMALGMLALMEHPDQLELLRSDPALMPTAVDELIRYASPVWHFRRTAVADTELRGVRIRAGERVVVWFAAANRDPEEFPDPHRLDLTRKRDVHAAFGRGGPHFCLGAHLARLELAVLFEQLLPRLASIELAGPPARLRSNFTNGLKRLPVRVVEAS
jgi:cytochrome P450